MSGPKDEARDQRVRRPFVAGTFYPRDAGECRSLADSYVRPRELLNRENASRWIGGIVPHAGWICSGAIAGQTIGTIAATVGPSESPHVVVILGAIHTAIATDRAVLDVFDRWDLPGSSHAIARPLREKLGANTDLFVTDDRFHQREHAVEVELPLIESAWPGSVILPVEVPTREIAIDVGVAIAETLRALNLNAVILASSDLTHYGPAYQLTPAGIGLPGLEWAKQNDRRLLECIEKFEVERIVCEVRENLNACGGGAIAAMLSACRALGATAAKILRHANSYETLNAAGYEQTPDNAVGYAAVVVG